MKTFHCQHCGGLVFFDNVQCVRCGHMLGFMPDVGVVGALEPEANGSLLVPVSAANAQRYRRCENWTQFNVCNWLVPAGDANAFCVACRLNEVIPNLSVPGNLEHWHKIEKAKRRVIYALIRLGLPLAGVPAEQRPALRFRFLADDQLAPPPLTGHSQGAITLNIAEADDAERERMRVHLREPYRTLVGHFRHEIAHYYWDRLIIGTPWVEQFRRLFGNEQENYDAALQRYYQTGPQPDWQGRYISAYASAHPWEDWAETWAHYLHIVDMVETAASFGITLNPEHPEAKAVKADLATVSDLQSEFGKVLEYWLPLTSALNSLNRGMGLPDLYPFVLSGPVIQKLEFINELILQMRSGPVGGWSVGPEPLPPIVDNVDPV